MQEKEEKKSTPNKESTADNKKMLFHERDVKIGSNEITLFCEELEGGELHIRHKKEGSKTFYTQWILKNGKMQERSRQIKSTTSMAVSNPHRDNQLKNEAKSLFNVDVEQHLMDAGRYISTNQNEIFPPKSFLERSLKDSQLLGIANEIEKREKIVKHSLTGELYRYKKKEGFYAQFDHKQFASYLAQLYKEKFLADEVSKILGSFANLKEESGNYIALKNCLLNLETLETEPFNKEKFVTFQVPYQWNPKAKSAFFETKIKQILGDNLELFLQILGYCFTPSITHQKMFFITGTGGNGKSTLMALIKAIFSDSVAAVALHQFKNEFGLQPLLGKRINLLYDLPMEEIKDTGQIKAITGGDLVNINRKHKETVNTVLGCKIIGIGNYLPPVNDDSYAFWRRIIHIELTNTFKDDNDDVEIKNKLIEDTEGMEWLIYQSICAYKNVEVNGWASEKTQDDIRKEYLLLSDPCLYAAEELFEKTIDPDDYLARDEVVNIISDYLKAQKIKLPKSNKPYYKAIRSIGGEDIYKTLTYNKIRAFAFIKTKNVSDTRKTEEEQVLATQGNVDAPTELEGHILEEDDVW
ncbi:MAG: phage/plasmid primase, P4 family [Methanobacterium sp.]|nr:phage/plasmid primase, P4 family [Methanobacterium sp.]